jgi:hypothetical protein
MLNDSCLPHELIKHYLPNEHGTHTYPIIKKHGKGNYYKRHITKQ